MLPKTCDLAQVSQNDEVMDRLEAVLERSALLEKLADRFERIAVFRVDGVGADSAELIRAVGFDGSFIGFEFPLFTETPLKWAIESDTLVLGAGGIDGAATLARSLNQSAPASYASFGLRIGEHLVALVYVDRTEGGIDHTSALCLIRLCMHFQQAAHLEYVAPVFESDIDIVIDAGELDLPSTGLLSEEDGLWEAIEFDDAVAATALMAEPSIESLERVPVYEHRDEAGHLRQNADFIQAQHRQAQSIQHRDIQHRQGDSHLESQQSKPSFYAPLPNLLDEAPNAADTLSVGEHSVTMLLEARAIQSTHSVVPRTHAPAASEYRLVNESHEAHEVRQRVMESEWRPELKAALSTFVADRSSDFRSETDEATLPDANFTDVVDTAQVYSYPDYVGAQTTSSEIAQTYQGAKPIPTSVATATKGRRLGMMPVLAQQVLALSFIAAGILAGYAAWALGVAKDTEVSFEVVPGEHMGEVAERLHRDGLIRDPRIFRWVARYTGVARKMRAGHYHFPAQMSAIQILNELAHGQMHLVEVTIPEGFTFDEIAQRLASKGLVQRQSLLAAGRSPQLLQELGIAGGRVEGFLFPDTYHISRGMEPAAIIRLMVSNFYQKTKLLRERYYLDAEKLYSLVTLASIVEEEAAHPAERARIAGVFHNRIERGMRLESCATIQYALGVVKTKLTLDDLQVHSPYNTYKRAGLPPTPIANPGLASIEAAFEPSQHNFLFFVSKQDGSKRHVFSRTFSEHQRAQTIYRN